MRPDRDAGNEKRRNIIPPRFFEHPLNPLTDGPHTMRPLQGWRGFALPRLQSEQSAFSSSIILGLAWSVWHLPYWFALTYATTGSVWRSLLAFASMVPTTVAVTILMTWVFNGVKGSVFAAMLMHAAHNSSVSIFTQPDQLAAFGDLAAPGALLTWATTATAFMIAAAVIVRHAGAENLSSDHRFVISWRNQ
jgi:hypothetical protein